MYVCYVREDCGMVHGAVLLGVHQNWVCSSRNSIENLSAPSNLDPRRNKPFVNSNVANVAAAAGILKRTVSIRSSAQADYQGAYVLNTSDGGENVRFSQ